MTPVSNKASKKKLFEKIDEFLAVRKESSQGGGWAPVGPNEVEELYEIFKTIVDLKYETDADGDTPIDIDVLDRTRFEPHHSYLALPYMHKAKTVEDVDEIISSASCNANTAMSRLDSLLKSRKFEVARVIGKKVQP